MRNLKFLVVSILAMVIAMNMAGCSRVPVGSVGVKVNMLGSRKGVDLTPVGPGRYFIGPNTQLVIFPTFTQNYVWTQSKEEGKAVNEEITFQTVDGMSIKADVGITYHIESSMAPAIYSKYLKTPDEITALYLRNSVRDAFVEVSSKLPIEAAYGSEKTAMVAEAERMVKEQWAPIGIVIESVYLIGDMRLPQNVVAALNQKIEATQRAQQRENEVREAEAQAQKDVAQANGKAEALLVEAKAQAEANTILNKSLTPTLVQYKQVEKWDGVLPVYTGGPSPLMTIK